MARREARAALLASAPSLTVHPGAAVQVEVIFIRPHGIRVSLSDLTHRMTAALEGLAFTLESDASRWAVTYRVSKVPTPGGAVLLKVAVLQAGLH